MTFTPSTMTARPIAAFDFDGTISDRDSLKDFTRFTTGWAAQASAYLRTGPTAALWACGQRSRQQTKTAFLGFCLGGRSRSVLCSLAEQYAATRLPRLIRPDMLARIHAHRQRGHQLVLVSASPSLYLRPWAQAAGFDMVLATELAYTNDIFHGELATPNCWGPEKVRRLAHWLGTPEVKLTYAYGDSRGDQEMLAQAQHPWLRGKHKTLPAL